MSRQELCSGCNGWVDPDRFEVLVLPKLNSNGQEVLDAEGKPARVYVRLPYHIQPATYFDATGLVPANCVHGAPQHPDPKVDTDEALKRRASSWVRSKYLDPKGQCPVCRGEAAPEDLATPRP